MARRLTPEARRAEIVSVARQVITEEGYRGLSLREIARRCGMSAPGLMHYFADMDSLLTAVLERRDEADIAAIASAASEGGSLAELIEAAAAYYADRGDDVRVFDALQAEALDPTHPAHEWFASRNARNLEALRPVLAREFADPDTALRLLKYLLDGMRVNRMWGDDNADFFTDLQAIRKVLVSGLEAARPR
jgi:AcrR family transcriptional regulator